MIDFSFLEEWKRKLLPHYRDTPEVRAFKRIVIVVAGMILLTLLTGLIAFLVTVRGEEEVLIPDTRGKDLVTVLLELQEKELYPRVQVRYSSEMDKGIVLEQKPAPGSLVRVGRRVTLVVSKGPVLDHVENYVGQKIEDVQSHLQTLFSSYRALLKIKEPVMYKSDEAPPGTILAQKPAAGSVIDGMTDLELVVSRGPQGEMVKIGSYQGMAFQEALKELSSRNIPFVFSVRKAKTGEKPGVVISQSLEAGREVAAGTAIQLMMTNPEGLAAGQVFGLFEYVLPVYPILVDIRLDALAAETTTTLLAMKHPGGPIAVPYVVDRNADLVLSVFDKEEIRRNASR